MRMHVLWSVDVMTWYCRGEGIFCKDFNKYCRKVCTQAFATFGLGISLNSLEIFAIVNQDAHTER
jgi:hypothetical protein